jgi:hypothetical protein
MLYSFKTILLLQIKHKAFPFTVTQKHLDATSVEEFYIQSQPYAFFLTNMLCKVFLTNLTILFNYRQPKATDIVKYSHCLLLEHYISMYKTCMSFPKHDISVS